MLLIILGAQYNYSKVKGHMDTILKTATYDMENMFQINVIYNKI